MPFDLDATTHQFIKNDFGGVQTVTADSADDAPQVGLIRAHLAAEATAFGRGDFSDPARIHGMDMPGLKELEDGASRVAVTYDDLAAGGQIVYASNEPGLVDAIHQWFDRQEVDHG